MNKQSFSAIAVNAVSPDNYAEDVVRGVRNIAAYIGETERRTHYLLERQMLPAYQIGCRWEMRKSTHRAYIAMLESA